MKVIVRDLRGWPYSRGVPAFPEVSLTHVVEIGDMRTPLVWDPIHRNWVAGLFRMSIKEVGGYHYLGPATIVFRNWRSYLVAPQPYVDINPR